MGVTGKHVDNKGLIEIEISCKTTHYYIHFSKNSQNSLFKRNVFQEFSCLHPTVPMHSIAADSLRLQEMTEHPKNTQRGSPIKNLTPCKIYLRRHLI